MCVRQGREFNAHHGQINLFASFQTLLDIAHRLKHFLVLFLHLGSLWHVLRWDDLFETEVRRILTIWRIVIVFAVQIRKSFFKFLAVLFRVNVPFMIFFFCDFCIVTMILRVLSFVSTIIF